MKIKRLSALLLTAVMLCSCGSKEETADTGNVGKQVGTVCYLESFSFDLKDDLQVKDTSAIDGVISMYFLTIPDSPATISVYEDKSPLVPEAYMEELKAGYDEEDLEYFSDMDWSILSTGDMTQALFSCKYKNLGESKGEMWKYCVFSQGTVLIIDENVPEGEEKIAKAKTERLLKNVRYFSDYRLPDGEQALDSRSFTGSIPANWTFIVNDDIDQGLSYCEFSPAVAETPGQAKCWVAAEANTSGDYADADAYLDMLFYDMDGYDISRSSGEYLGHEARIASYITDAGLEYTVTVFMDGDTVYSFGSCKPEKDESSAKIIDELLGCIKIKG